MSHFKTLLVFTAVAFPVYPAMAQDIDYNQEILGILKSDAVKNDDPRYKSDGEALNRLKTTITVDASGKLESSPGKMGACFCSAGTYGVLMKLISQEQAKGNLTLSAEKAKTFTVKNQADGDGPWGMFNGNSTCALKFLKNIGVAKNFAATLDTLDKVAKPGDLIKIMRFWIPSAKGGEVEHGHLAYYMGMGEKADPSGKTHKCIKIWSCNDPGGMSRKCYDGPIAALAVSRITDLKKLQNVSAAQLNQKDKECTAIGGSTPTFNAKEKFYSIAGVPNPNKASVATQVPPASDNVR